MLHAGDIVEEIATKRSGKINGTRGWPGTTPLECCVYFSDGKDPVIKLFFHEEELRLIECPHSDAA